MLGSPHYLDYGFSVKEDLSNCLQSTECLMRSPYPLCDFSPMCRGWKMTLFLAKSIRGFWYHPSLYFQVLDNNFAELDEEKMESFGLEAVVREERRKYIQTLFFVLAAILEKNKFNLPEVSEEELFLINEDLKIISEDGPKINPSINMALAFTKKAEAKVKEFSEVIYQALIKQFEAVSLAPACQNWVLESVWFLIKAIEFSRPPLLLYESNEKILWDVEKFLRNKK